MVISNENHLFSNEHVKCGVQREGLLKNFLYKHNLSSPGFSSAFVELENVLSVSDIEDADPSFSLYKTDLTKKCDINKWKLERNKEENQFVDCQNQCGVTNEDCLHDLPNVTLQEEYYSETDICDEKLDNLYSIPDSLMFNKKNDMFVNYTLTNNKEIDETLAPSNKERELHTNICQYKHLNLKDVLKKSTNIYNRHEFDSNSSHPQTKDKCMKNEENIKNNVQNKKQKKDEDANFPYSHSSFVSKEYKTTSFFDDYLRSHPSFSSYSESPEYHRFGCSADCIGTKIDDIFKISIENELCPHVPTKSMSEFDPQICYMEPKYCSMSCQGIPYRTQKCRVIPKRLPVYLENNISNSCCTSNLNSYTGSGLMDSDERCCRRKPVPTNLFQDDTLYQRQPAYCSLKKTATIAERNPFQTNIHGFNQYRRQKECCNCNKTTVESTKITKSTDDHFNQGSPETKKKKHFTCCKSGKVDQNELSTIPKPTSDRTQQNFQQTESQNIPSNVKRNTFADLHPSDVPIQNVYTDDNFDSKRDCPMMMQHLLYIPPPQNTKCVGSECSNKCDPPKPPDNTIDVGRNITIQIIPNCAQPSCCEYHNTPNVTYPKAEQRITYPQTICCPEIPCEREQNNSSNNTNVRCQQATYAPYTQHKSNPKDGEQYPKYNSKNNSSKWWGCNWRRKKPQTPYHRNPNSLQTSNCTTKCQDINDFVPDDCHLVEISNCQRVLPIRNNYINRDGNLLKSLHHLNRGLLKDLFATPCASSSSACPNVCLKKMRGAPFPLCAGTNPTHMEKPLTTNKCCQYEPDCNYSERDRTCDSSQDILFECLRYLKMGMRNEQHCEYLDEDCCCCCCQSFNSCCCCHQTPRCREIKSVIQPKVEQKKSKSCCTRCRSVEAKQSLRHCGTVVSSHCFTKVETVCTNTEIPKTPEIRKKRICCKRRCCCCNNTRNCCCCCERFSYTEPPTTCYRNIHASSCKGEHLIYCCQCESKQIFESKNFISKETIEPSFENDSERLNNIKKAVSKETAIARRKQIISDLYFDSLNTSQEKPINTNSPTKYRPQRKNVLIKSITLDLCDLGEKKISKFGVPSQHYPWTNNSFFIDMPHEINRFVELGKTENLLSGKEYDPTPCLKPEVINCSQNQQVKSRDNANNIDEKNARGDIEKVCEVKKRYLSTICKAFFDNRQTNDHNFSSIMKENKNFNSFNYAQLKKKDISKKEKSDKNGTNCKDNDLKKQKMLEDNIALKKQVELATKNKNLPKNNSKFTSRTSPIMCKTSSNIPKKSLNISRTSSNIINYTPKPFTTKTGLMSFIPSFRDISRNPPLVNKHKPTIRMNKDTKIPKKLKNNKIEERKEISTKEMQDLCSCENNITSTDTNKLIKEETKVDSRNEISKPKSGDLDIQESYITRDELGKKQITEEVIKVIEQNEDINAPIDLRNFNKEIHAFYEKCFKRQRAPRAEMKIPFFKTSVSDILKSMESNSSINSQINTKEHHQANSLENFPNEEIDSIAFSSKTNIELYSEIFQRSYSQSNMQIPNKIMSKTDLISLN